MLGVTAISRVAGRQVTPLLARTYLPAFQRIEPTISRNATPRGADFSRHPVLNSIHHRAYSTSRPSPGSGPLVTSGKAENSDAEDTKCKDFKIDLGFADSGAGGAIFMIQAYATLCDFLIESTAKYTVKFSFRHIGDGHNAPYGGKPPTHIKMLNRAMMTYLDQKSVSIAVIACNTASTPFNAAEQQALKKLAPNMEVIPIIRPTAEVIHQTGRLIPNGRGKKEVHIGLLATRATITSQRYNIELAKLHTAKYSPDGTGEQPYTIIINADPFIKGKLENEETFQFYRVYEGRNPVKRGSHDEKVIFQKINTNQCMHPVQYIHEHAPSSWVSIIEGKGVLKEKNESTGIVEDKDLGTMTTAERGVLLDTHIENEMKIFFDFSYKFFKMTKQNPFEGLSSVVLACTHYPKAEKGIQQALWGRKLDRTTIVSQGDVLATTVIKSAIIRKIETGLDNGSIQKRDVPLPPNTIPLPTLRSETTVDPNLPKDLASFEVVKDVSKEINSLIAGRIKFSMIDPLSPINSDDDTQ